MDSAAKSPVAGEPGGAATSPGSTTTAAALDDEAMERLVDAVACEVYEQSCFAILGGDVGMTYWRDLSKIAKQGDLARARELILAALVDGGEDAE